MNVIVEDCMFLSSTSGDFETREGETRHWQRAQFVQIGDDGGSAFNLSVSDDINLDDFQRLRVYRLEVFFSEFSTASGRGFRGRVIGYEGVTLDD